MIGLIFRKTAFEVWDNGVIVFCLNLGFVALVLSIVLAVGRWAAHPIVLTSVIFLLAIVIMVAMGFLAGLFDQIVRQAEISRVSLQRRIARLTPCALVLSPLLLGAAALSTSIYQNIAGLPVSVQIAAVTMLAWLWFLALQIAVLAMVSMAVEGANMRNVLAHASGLALGRPLVAATAFLGGLLLAVLTLGLYPGVVGGLRLLSNASQLHTRIPVNADPAARASLISKERQLLSRRTTGSIIFPWRLR